MRDGLGWDLPAGAANDPNAPWNEEDHAKACPASEDAPAFCGDCDGVIEAELGRDEDSDEVCDEWDRYLCRCAQADSVFLRLARWLGLSKPYVYNVAEPECECDEIDEDARVAHAEEREGA